MTTPRLGLNTKISYKMTWFSLEIRNDVLTDTMPLDASFLLIKQLKLKSTISWDSNQELEDVCSHLKFGFFKVYI